MPQLEMSARRSVVGAAQHREMHGYSAVDVIGENGREVVTGQMVFADIDQSNHMETDHDPITYMSTAAGEGDGINQLHQQTQQPQPTSLLKRRQTPQNVEEKFFNVSSRSIYTV